MMSWKYGSTWNNQIMQSYGLVTKYHNHAINLLTCDVK